MKIKPEIWLPTPGHFGYEVSDQGRVRSIDRVIIRAASVYRKASRVTLKGRLLRPGKMNRFGHVSVALGRRNSQCVHSLVLLAFVGPRPKGADTLHLNNDGGDNRLVNLRWGTRSENCLQAYRDGRR